MLTKSSQSVTYTATNLNKLRFTIRVISFFTLLFVATVSAVSANENLALNKTMTQVGSTMMQLFPLILNEEKFKQPKNQETIANDVNTIVRLLGGAEPHFKQRAQTNRISYSVLINHLHDAQQAISNGNPRFARSLLKDTVTVCTSCHMQDDQQSILFRSQNREAFANDYEYAEFSYLTRNYDSALRYYDRYINSPASLKPQTTVLSAARKILTIYTQVYNEPSGAISQFQQYLGKDDLPVFVKSSIQEWIKGLKELQSNGAAEVEEVTFSELEDYVHKYLGPLDNPGAAVVPTKKERVYHVWLQGLLYRFLQADPPEDQMPKLLYWLAINDRATHYSFYYSLADLYLKECMLSYTPHYYAKKCFEEYNEYITFSYSGSLGTNIPEDEQEELRRLRDIVYGKQDS
jgi:hypothetical protein